MKYDIWITEEDLQTIRQAVLTWGKPFALAQEFYGADLHRYYGAWEIFVETDWSKWDISEYNHDIGVRQWIQLAIEHSCPETQARLQAAVNPIDAIFQSKMRPYDFCSFTSFVPFANSPYFWEVNTIYPEA